MLKEDVTIIEQDAKLKGFLTMPKNPLGIVIFANGEGTNRFSALNQKLIEFLFSDGIATLLIDLLSDEEAQKSSKTRNVKLLNLRLESVLDWVAKRKVISKLPIGVLGYDTGAAATMATAAQSKHEVISCVTLGGRIDMADKFLPYVDCPVLLIAGSMDELGVKANANMIERLSYARMQIIEGADHLFTNEQVSEQVESLTSRWFKRYFKRKSFMEHLEDYHPRNLKLPFYDRIEAANFLAYSLVKHRPEDPLVLAIPREGVSMADVISTELDCEMDIILAKDIIAPNSQNTVIGSVNEYGDVYLNGNTRESYSEDIISRLAQNSQKELAHQRERFGSANEPKDYTDRTIIIVDDGIASGSTMLSAVITAKEKGARKVIVAAPVVSKSAKKMLELASDETHFLCIPDNFYSVAQFYNNYPHVGDSEIEEILR